MAVKLTEHQMMILKRTVRMSEAFANSLLHIMRNHGLDKIDGCDITIQVNPKYETMVCDISIGEKNSDFGDASFIKGAKDDGFELWSHCSAEYKSLFDDEENRRRKHYGEKVEKPLPPDGLWIGDPRNDYPVDCRWEWDLNDSLS